VIPGVDSAIDDTTHAAISIPDIIENVRSAGVGLNGGSIGGISWTTVMPYLNITINIVFTLLIVIRLLAHRRYIRRTVGTKLGSQYTGLAAMLIESSALYAIVGLLFEILLARNSPISLLFFSPMTQAQVSSPKPATLARNSKCHHR
jgi:hypothetical protein